MGKLLENTTGIIGALSITIIAISASHEFGYFLLIGSFFQTFATASDYFTNALLWAPIAVVTTATLWNSRFLWEDTPRPRRKEWRTWILPAILIGLPAANFIFLAEGLPELNLLFITYLWFLLFDKWVTTSKRESQLSNELRKLFKIAVPVCLFFIFRGYTSTKNELATVNNPYFVRLNDSSDTHLLIPLRSFEKGILVRDPVRKRIEFIRWDLITTIIKPAENPIPVSPWCLWTHLGCDEKKEIPYSP